MALPWIIGGGIVVILGKVIYDAVTSGGSNSTIPKPDIIFLTGETGVGKDTIMGILDEAKFIEEHTATAKMYKSKPLDLSWLGCKVCIYNTGGADEQADINSQEKEKLQDELKKYGVKVFYTYVFDANVYFSDSNKRELIKVRLESSKKLAQQFGFELRIIGTHRDIARKYESKMNELVNELRGKYGECQIYDLTQAKTNGTQMQQKLFEFIIKG